MEAGERIKMTLHWEEAMPGGLRHFKNFVLHKFLDIPIKYFHPCTRSIIIERGPIK